MYNAQALELRRASIAFLYAMIIVSAGHAMHGTVPAVLFLYDRVKSGNFGHQVNSDIYLQIVEIQMRRLLIRIFTVCLVNLFLYSKNQNMKTTRSLSEFT